MRGVCLEQADVLEWAKSYEGERFQAVLSDPPYALISINKRFGKAGSAPAKEGTDGRFSRLSKGFMGQTWDGFQSLSHYQQWVAEWSAALRENVLLPGALCLFFGGTRTWHRLACGLEEGGLEVYDTLLWLYGQGFPKSHKTGEGYGTALKPAWEPVLMCRVPRGKLTYKKLLENYGTASLNIDGVRIPTDDEYVINTFDKGAKPWGNASGEAYTGRTESKGRWPSNILLDDESAVLVDSAGPKTSKSKRKKLSRKRTGFKISGSKDNVREADAPDTYGDGGGASRFFYCAKASKKEKGLDNTHPTVKPLDLNKYLATLILPPKAPRRLLVPFSGSGSEVIGARLAGWEHVTGVEISEEYNTIALNRVVSNGVA